jgi:hypothetical protein
MLCIVMRFGRDRVAWRSLGARCFTLRCLRFMMRLLTWDRAGSLGESGGPSIGKDGECDMESWHLQDCSPHLCRLRIDGLAPVSKYWTYWSRVGDMGPVNRYSWSVADAWLYPYYFNGFNGRPTDWQPACNGLGRVPFLLGAIALSNVVDDFAKDCHVWGLPIGSVCVAYVDWREKRMCHVYQVSLAGCTSIQIIMTLGYE